MDVVLVLSKHVSDSMNQYKQAWMIQAAQYPLNPMPRSTKKRSKNKSLSGQVKDHFVQHTIEYATLTALSYMATSQWSGAMGPITRTIGKIGIRAVPIIMIGVTAWEIYKFLDD